MVHVEHGALRALEQHLLAGLNRVVNIARGIGDVGGQAVAQATVVIEDVLILKRLFFQQGAEVNVFLFEVALQLPGEHVFVQEIDKANPDTGHLVFIRGTNPPAGRPDLALAAEPLPREINGLVVGGNQMGDFTDLERVRVRQAALLPEGIDFLNQHFGVDHHAIADHAHLAVVQHARRDEPDDGFLPPNNQGVTRVVPALKTDNDIRFA